jgi:cysteine desulfurase
MRQPHCKGIVGPEVANRIYLDNHSTTPVDPRVAGVVTHHMIAVFGNPSSADHLFGDEAERAVDEAAAAVGRLVGAPGSSVIFTSGATESINLAIQGFAAAHTRNSPLRVAVSPTEHAAVLDTCRALAHAGRAEVQLLSVNNLAQIDLDEIEQVCTAGLDLLCVMAANNEVGTIAPVSQIAEIAQRHGVAYLCDATQAVGRIPLAAAADGVTFLALSAHKMYGPKGVGALVVSSKRHLRPLLHGGGQQGGLRAGTLNVPGIAGLGASCDLRRAEMATDEPRIAQLRDWLQAELASVGAMTVNGDTEARLSGNLHVSFQGVPNHAVIARVRDRLAIATGSACSSGVEAPSHVLRAMRLPKEVVDGALRIGLGKYSTRCEVESAAEWMLEAVRCTRARTLV